MICKKNFYTNPINTITNAEINFLDKCSIMRDIKFQVKDVKVFSKVYEFKKQIIP